MLIKRFYIWMTALLAAGMLSSCVREDVGSPSERNPANVSFDIKVKSPEQVVPSRAATEESWDGEGIFLSVDAPVESRAEAPNLSESDEQMIYSVLALQYENDVLIAKSEVWVDDSEEIDGHWVHRVELTLEESRSSKVFLLGNVENLADKIVIGSGIGWLKGAEHLYRNEWSIPMTGFYDGPVPAQGVKVEMIRMMAKLSMAVEVT